MIDKSQKNSFVDIDVDLILEKLLSVRGSKPGKLVSLTENEIRGLCLKSRDIFASQPILLEIEAPLKICGKSLRFFNNDPLFYIYRGCAWTILRLIAAVRVWRLPA